METKARFQMVCGEDYAAYVEWVDDNNVPVASVEGSSARMQVRDPASNNIVLDFQETGDIELEPVVNVLGSSGIIRLTCPRAITLVQIPGTYIFDLVVDHIDPDRLIFINGQRKYVISGDFVVKRQVTTI